MPYATDVIFHVPFDTEPLADLVTSSFLTVTGSTPAIVDGVFDGAWQMADDVYAQVEGTISPTSALTIGFWLESVNPGVVSDPVTHVSMPLKMPLLSKATFTTSGSILVILAYTFQVWEETQEDGRNILKVSIRGTKNSSLAVAQIDSSPYEVGVPHHFWIAFDGNAGTFQLFVDTIEDVSAVHTGTVPSTLNVNAAKLQINFGVGGPFWQQARNQGKIDDLVIFSSAKTSGNTVVRAANSGALYVADTTLADVEEIDQGIVFDDPGTAQITSVHSNRGRLYVARSDGKLLRGTKLLWESRREFSNDKEINNLATVNKGDGGYVRVSLGSLKIQDKIVRV